MPTAVNRNQALFSTNSLLSQDSSQQSESPSQNDRETTRGSQSQASAHPSQSQTTPDKILFRLETEHPKVLIGMLMSFGSSSSSSSSSSSAASRSQRSQKGSGTQATITQSMMLLNASGAAANDMSASIGQMTIYTTETGLQLHQSTNLSSQSSMELPKELFSYYQTSATPATSSGGATQTSSTSSQTAGNCCCCISWKPLRNALILAMTQNPNKLSMTYNMNDEVLHVETECGGTIMRRSTTASYSFSGRAAAPSSSSSSSSTGVVCTAVVSGLVPPEEQPQLSQAFLQHPIVARILVPSTILMDVLELALVSPMAIQLQWKTTTVQAATESKKSVLQVSAVGPCSECAVQWQIPIEWTNQNNIELLDDNDDTATTDDGISTRMSSLDGSRRKRKSHENAKRTVRKVKHSYPYEAWAQAMKPLLDSQAHETCISVNEQGILAIQHQLLCHDNIAAFCDGLLVPLIVEEDEDDDDGDSDANSETDDDRTDASSRMTRSNTHTQGSSSSAGSSRDHRTAAHFTPSQSTVGHDDNQDDDDSGKNSQQPIDLSRQSVPANKSQRSTNDDDDDGSRHDESGGGGIEPSFFGALPVVDDDNNHAVGAAKRPSSRFSSIGSNASSSSRRREERKRLRAQQRLPAGSDAEPSASVSQQLSPVVLPSTSSPPDHLEDDDHMEPTQTQDEDDEEERYCSSPEVVYGKI
ncbi:unnamed protein product [Cylindrotheca closterium]|uniref:Uncharacterized protein n=1 Tax=Cylindrotheca closterium TaxID=2856 RepID=A0AAD2CNP8_9STRA|nr:unnamed protein product [Cylindrotheca closterium]